MTMAKPLCFIMSLVVISSGLTAYTPTTEKPKNPNYDAALAKKLGAGEFGIKMYVLAILKKGPYYSTIQAKDLATRSLVRIHRWSPPDRSV